MVALPLGGEAEAASKGRDQPYVHAREQWGARPPRQAAELADRSPDRIIVHHTATLNTKDYSLNQAYRLSREIQRFHMDRFGWDDIGEQLTISRGGYVMEGRNRSLAAIRTGRHVIGAQMRGHNHHTIGIENEGSYARAKVPEQLWSSLVDTCVWLCEVYKLDPFEAVRGHRDYSGTDCPGDVLYERLPELRKAVARRLKESTNQIPEPDQVPPAEDLLNWMETPPEVS